MKLIVMREEYLYFVRVGGSHMQGT